jgi:hypothetical protein
MIKVKDGEHSYHASRNRAVALAISAAQKLGMRGADMSGRILV